MSTRRLGSSDLNITPVGFGAWAIGGTGYDFAWGKLDDADSIAAIHRSLELGVNWIDTAPVYGTGHSEEIVASALKEWRGSRPYVFTKCVMRWDEKGRVTTVFNRDSIRRECDDSLRRLQVDVIDLYQMHWPPADNGPGLEEAWQTMAGLQKEGKSPVDRRLAFHRRADRARGENCAGDFAAASLFVDPPADRNGNTPVLREAGNWRHRVFADGIRFVDRRDDP
jgi:aryl-alcohol dehydrogenase-like predicted oxidoreductase